MPSQSQRRAHYDDDEFDGVLEEPEQISEIQCYQELQFPHSDETTIVLEFWQTNGNMFPAISCLGQRQI